jgi:hypothetical protein
VLHFKKTLFSSWPNTGAKSDAMPPKAEAANGRIVSADDDDDDDDDARPIADTPRFPNRARSALVDDDAIGSGRTLCTHAFDDDGRCVLLFFSLLLLVVLKPFLFCPERKKFALF